MIPMNDKELKESMDTAEDLLKESSSEEEEEENSSDEDDEEYTKIIKNETITKIKRNTCNCEICAKARACLINYSTHDANDQLAQIFKNAINHSLKMQKLII